jgi:hypothetical protein
MQEKLAKTEKACVPFLSFLLDRFCLTPVTVFPENLP